MHVFFYVLFLDLIWSNVPAPGFSFFGGPMFVPVPGSRVRVSKIEV